MNNRKIHETPSPSPESEDCIRWKQQTKAIISDLKKELSHPPHRVDVVIDNVMNDVEVTRRYQALLEDMLIQAVHITNQKYAYFEQEKDMLWATIFEYQNISLEDKESDFLKTFRKQIGATIKKYTGCLEEMDGFSKEFIKPLHQLCEKGSQVGYIESKADKIKEGKERFKNIRKEMEYLITYMLLPKRKQAFHLLKQQKQDTTKPLKMP